jgi:hypothetical protein
MRALEARCGGAAACGSGPAALAPKSTPHTPATSNPTATLHHTGSPHNAEARGSLD